MLPYLPNFIPIDYRLFGLLPIRPFGILVVTAIIIGFHTGRRRAISVGLDRDTYERGFTWTLAIAFIISHIVDVTFYYPERILADPLVLFKLWDGLSSMGGFFGAVVGVYVFFKLKMKVSALQYAETFLFGIVPAWIFGRMGCTVVYDHPGIRTDFFLGMAYRDGIVRHNLGLYEMLFAIVLTTILYLARNKRPFHGFHFALILVCYAPVRFLLDFLRTADKHYWGLTPGQYFAFAMIAVAVLLTLRGLKEGPPQPVKVKKPMRPAKPAKKKRRR